MYHRGVIRTFTYPLLPSRRQGGVLQDWLERCRLLYNVALEQRREWWRMGKDSSYFGQTKELTELRASDSRYGLMPVEVCRSPLRQLQRAFDGYFRRIKSGEYPGYPRWKGRGRLNSFEIGRIIPQGKKLRIPKLGLVKYRNYRELKGDVLTVRLVFKAGKWQVAFSCDLGLAPERLPVQDAVGIDLGLNSFATLSDGTKILNPRFFRKGEYRLAKRQRVLARRREGSNGRAAARLLVQKAHAHVRNQRLDFARKLVAELYRTFDCVFYEDLNLRSLASGRNAKSVLDASWGIFIRTLACKAECAGSWAVPVDPRGTSLRCSRCGLEVQKCLSDRVHRCPRCRLAIDRDENAARNILALGRSATVVFGHSPTLDATQLTLRSLRPHLK